MTYISLILSVLASFIVTSYAHAGPDDLDQFFSEAEIREALGTRAEEMRRSGALTPVNSNAEANDDDGDVRDAARNQSEGSIRPAGAEGRGSAPVWGPFVTAFRQCAPGCLPANYNIYRPGRHSCHSQGKAIDVGAITCGGSTYPAIQAGRFKQVVGCMQNHMIVLYQEQKGRGPTRDHYDHAHFSIGCVL